LGDVVITGQATDRFNVELDQAARRNLPLVVWHTGELDPAFLLSNERTGERNVRLEGPKQVVEHVAIARLEPDLGELSAGLESSGDSLTAALQVRLYDADNNPVTNPTLKVSPEKVDYTADLKPVGNFKVLRVVPAFRGAPAPGYLVVAAEPDPHYVPVEPGTAGKDDFAVRTEPIDISGAKADFDRKVKLRYPLAMAVSKPGIEECTVHFLIRKVAEEEGQFPVSIEVLGKQAGYEYILVPSAVRLAQGSKGSLPEQHVSAVRAKLDVSGMGQGVFQVVPQLELPLHFNTIRISPPSLRLTILRPAEGGE
jgi:YbbR domain-containing protein